MLQCGLSGLLPNISKVEDYAKWLNPQAKQTAGKDFVYPLFKKTKAGNTKRRALRTTA